jgi:hypothetical protein
VSEGGSFQRDTPVRTVAQQQLFRPKWGQGPLRLAGIAQKGPEQPWQTHGLVGSSGREEPRSGGGGGRSELWAAAARKRWVQAITGDIGLSGGPGASKPGA